MLSCCFVSAWFRFPFQEYRSQLFNSILCTFSNYCDMNNSFLFCFSLTVSLRRLGHPSMINCDTYQGGQVQLSVIRNMICTTTGDGRWHRIKGIYAHMYSGSKANNLAAQFVASCWSWEWDLRTFQMAVLTHKDAAPPRTQIYYLEHLPVCLSIYLSCVLLTFMAHCQVYNSNGSPNIWNSEFSTEWRPERCCLAIH